MALMTQTTELWFPWVKTLMEVLSPRSLLHAHLSSPRGEDDLGWGDTLSTGAGGLCLAIPVCLSGSSFFPGVVCRDEGREDSPSPRSGHQQQIPIMKPASVGCQPRGTELKPPLMKGRNESVLMRGSLSYRYPRLSLLLGFHLFRLRFSILEV